MNNQQSPGRVHGSETTWIRLAGGLFRWASCIRTARSLCGERRSSRACGGLEKCSSDAGARTEGKREERKADFGEVRDRGRKTASLRLHRGRQRLYGGDRFS